MLMATMVGLIVFASDAFRRILWHGGVAGGGRRSSGGKGNPIAIVLIVIALLLSIIAPLLALMIRFAVSRQREFLADAGAVELTRYPQGMISALEKLGSSTAPLDRANRATAHLYIVNPLRTKKDRHELNSVFRTHPPMHERLARLRALIT
jgi:heat shock protein HtpX